MRRQMFFCLRLFALSAFGALAACVPEEQVVTRPAPGGPGGICTAEPQFETPNLNTCRGGERLRLAMVGDVLLHWQIQEYGYKVGFHNVWAQAEPFLKAADIAIANVEGPVAPGITRAGARVAEPGPVGGSEVYTGFPLFNYHPVVLRDLKAAGVDLVTTANNHAMDRGPLGVDLTLDESAKAGLGAVGTIRRGAPRQFVTRRATKAGTLSFIACSFSTNGIADPKRQVLLCYRDRRDLLALVRREAADPGVAGVIVLPHWGVEYSTNPDANQRALAGDLARAGATAVVGTHPHTVQRFGLETGPGGSRIPVAFSTGNFVATQDFMPAKVGAMALVDLCPGTGGKLVAARAGWIAMQMRFTSRGYWLEIAPRGAGGEAGQAYAFMSRIAPGFSAQPAACGS